MAATAVEIQRKAGRPKGVAPQFRDMTSSLEAAIRASISDTTIRWPSSRYQDNPVAFSREVLGINPWSKQSEILESVRDHKRVAIRSGHKCGKSTTLAILALWFYCSYKDARVVMTSVTSRQVDAILFREVKKLRLGAKHHIDGSSGELARTGIKADDFREIVGFTAKDAEAVAGISGANLLYLCDEASGIPDSIFEAIEGNRAGGARIVLASNPTRTEGEFFRAFDSAAYHRIHVSSEHSPNVVEGKDVVPGLAGREWVEEKRTEWGEDSPLFKVRVRGEFVRNEEGKIISLHALEQSHERWFDAVPSGRLHIGLDPAGESGAGDESVFAVRQGLRVHELYAHRGLTPDGHVAQLLGIISRYTTERSDRPMVTVDRDGEVGARVYGALRAYLDRNAESFELVGVRSGEWAKRDPKTYERVRDELWGNAARWLRDGGALPEDAKLDRELHAPEWIHRESGRQKVTPKDELRKSLDRSTDRADAVLLSIWETASWEHQPAAEAKHKDVYDQPTEIDAYKLDGLGGSDDELDTPGDGVYS